MLLFAEHGYDRTTTAQVARHAGLSEMTLFRHFASKEALLLEDPLDPVMADEVRARPVSENPMRAVAEGIRQAWSTMAASEVAHLRWLLGVVSDTPSLQGALERSSGQTASALAAALEDRGVATCKARLASAAVIAGLSRALLDWSRDEECDLDARVNLALDILGGR
ncbi:MAG: TetR/AcrR family transcriptional regulator [Actinomycetota bacterium]|nr:TetR/AcrR family transcriptional regulator [Actinomycetota bacterium]